MFDLNLVGRGLAPTVKSQRIIKPKNGGTKAPPYDRRRPQITPKERPFGRSSFMLYFVLISTLIVELYWNLRAFHGYVILKYWRF
jgi:hypothetical protein